MRRMRMEGVQVVLGGLRLDVLGLVGQMSASGVDSLALGLQHSCDWVLGEPVDLQIWLQFAQLTGDRNVALGVAEADRRGDEQGTGPAVGSVDGGIARRARPPEGVLGELAQRQVDLDRLARVRQVPGATDDLQPGVGEASQSAAVAERRDLVVVAVDDHHRAVELQRQLTQGRAAAVDVAPSRGDQRRRVGFQRPADPVLDRLGRVRLRNAARDEPLDELGKVL